MAKVARAEDDRSITYSALSMKLGTVASFIKLPDFKTCIYFSLPFVSIVCGSAIEIKQNCSGAVKVATVLEACNRSQVKSEEKWLNTGK
jgi:hypothetical protein